LDACQLRVTAIDGFRQATAGHQHGVTRLEAGVFGGPDYPGQIDAPDQWIAPQDLARAGRGQRILVVDVRALDLDDHLTRRKLFEREVLETARCLSVGLVNAICPERAHGCSRVSRLC